MTLVSPITRGLTRPLTRGLIASAAAGDTTPPVVSNILVGTEVDAGYTGSGDVPVSFDLSDDVQANNTVYYVIYPSAASAPNATEVQAGQVSGGAASDASGSIVSQPGDGITRNDAIPDGINGTYRLAMVAVDGSGNVSAVATSSAVAINTVTLSRTHLDRHTATSNDGTAGRYTFPGVTLGAGTIVVALQWASNNAITTTSVTVDGSPAAILNDGAANAEANRSNIAYAGLFAVACSSATGDVVVQLSADAALHGVVIDLYLVSGSYAVTDTAIAAVSVPAEPYQASVDVNVLSTGIVFAAQGGIMTATCALECLAGVTQDGSVFSLPSAGVNRFIAGSAAGLSAETPRTVTLGQDTDTEAIFHIVTVAASLEPA